jgi:hypothetical protein
MLKLFLKKVKIKKLHLSDRPFLDRGQTAHLSIRPDLGCWHDGPIRSERKGVRAGCNSPAARVREVGGSGKTSTARQA